MGDGIQRFLKSNYFRNHLNQLKRRATQPNSNQVPSNQIFEGKYIQIVVKCGLTFILPLYCLRTAAQTLTLLDTYQERLA